MVTVLERTFVLRGMLEERNWADHGAWQDPNRSRRASGARQSGETAGGNGGPTQTGQIHRTRKERVSKEFLGLSMRDDEFF